MDAFDADIVIYASKQDPRGDMLVAALDAALDTPAGIGSTLLLCETFLPGVDVAREPRITEILSGLELRPVDSRVAELAARLRGLYRLKTPDAVHLATALESGSDRFVTGNSRDFAGIREIEIVHPPDVA